jgi:hypothetical protein
MKPETIPLIATLVCIGCVGAGMVTGAAPFYIAAMFAFIFMYPIW